MELAKELRIGNYIKSKPLSIPRMNISSDGIMKVTGYGISVIENDTNGSMGFEPITLTEEWLIKFGFHIDDEDEKGTYRFQIGNNQDFMVNILSNESGFSLGWRNDFCSVWKEVKFVHTVQNMVFFLTGEELEVK